MGGDAASARGAMRGDVHLPARPAADRSRGARPDGIVAGIRRGHAYFEMSTNSPELVKRLHAAFAERGAHMLDAPISGGATGAQRGQLAIWVGGDKAAFERYEPCCARWAIIRCMSAASAPDWSPSSCTTAQPKRCRRRSPRPSSWRQGRRRAVVAMGGHSPGRGRAAPHLRRPDRPVPARELRPATGGPARHLQGHDDRHRARP